MKLLVIIQDNFLPPCPWKDLPDYCHATAVWHLPGLSGLVYILPLELQLGHVTCMYAHVNVSFRSHHSFPPAFTFLSVAGHTCPLWGLGPQGKKIPAGTDLPEAAHACVTWRKVNVRCLELLRMLVSATKLTDMPRRGSPGPSLYPMHSLGPVVVPGMVLKATEALLW